MNYYYGLVDKATNAWGFIEEIDPRVHEEMIFLTRDEWRALLKGQSQGNPIVYYEGKVFNDPEPGRHYLDKDGWHRKTDEVYFKELADTARASLVQYNYEQKAARAYGGVIINDLLIFETNQTAITNTVASLALMDDTDTTNWKFYNKNGEPVSQDVTKLQIAGIAKFGRKMIDACFKVEAQFNQTIAQASIEDLNNPEYVENLKTQIKEGMEAVPNTLTVQF